MFTNLLAHLSSVGNTRLAIYGAILVGVLYTMSGFFFPILILLACVAIVVAVAVMNSPEVFKEAFDESWRNRKKN